MNGPVRKYANLKARLLGTELDFGLVLVNVCQMELALGDSDRAALALAEARAIHEFATSMLQRPRVAPVLRRKALKLAHGVNQVGKSVAGAPAPAREQNAVLPVQPAAQLPKPLARAAASAI